MKRSYFRLGNVVTTLFFILICAVIILQYIPTNYVVYQPGTAEEVGPMLEIDGKERDPGPFMLTTVYQSYPNMLTYLRLMFDPYAEFNKKEDVLREGENVDEYNGRQAVNMLASQSNAIMAVYEELDIPYHFKDEGLYVQGTVAGYPAADVLQPWDRLQAVDGVPVVSFEDLAGYLNEKDVGEQIELMYSRSGVNYTVSFNLVELPQDDEDASAPPSVGIGVSLLALGSVESDDEQYRVHFIEQDLVGPSAGLMFALEIYNRLVPEDITKGYRVAGTGEISAEGQVGIIGGIQHKVVAADREQAEIFFAPADYADEERELYIPNYSEAVAMAEQLKTSMKVVEVRSLDDALAYLETLKKK